MKHRFLKNLTMAFALLSGAITAQADGYVFTLNTTADWTQALSAASDQIIYSSPNIYYTAAATDGKVFTLPAPISVSEMISYSSEYLTQGYYFASGSQAIWSGGNADSAFPDTDGTKYFLGPAMATDNSGVLYCASAREDEILDWAEPVAGVTYYTVRPGASTSAQRTYLSFGNYAISGRTDIMSAYGDGITSGSKGYLWFAPNDLSVVECVVIEGAVAKYKKSFSTPASNVRRGYVKQFGNYLLWSAGATGSSTTELYIGELDGEGAENSTSVTWTATGLKSVRHGSTAFIIRDHIIICYSSSTTEVTVYDYTDGKVLGTITPFETASTQSYFSHIMDAKDASGDSADLYIYVPKQGAAKYTITATFLEDLKVDGEVVVNTTDAPNRQDAVLSWNKISVADGYKVEYYTTYTTDKDYTTSTVTLAEKTTETTATLKDICWKLSSSTYYSRTYHFSVTPLDANGNALTEATTIELTPDLLATPVEWRSYDPIKNYEGYSKLQLFWTKASYGCAPNYYNVYRDGVKINEMNLLVFNFIDLLVAEGNHDYYVEGCYYQSDKMTGNTTSCTSTETVYVAARNPLKTSYSLEEIYNHRIGTEVKANETLYPNLATRTRYKQGFYYDGAWYIAQQATSNTMDWSNPQGTAGVIKLPAHTSNDILGSNTTGTKVIDFSPDRNCGIGMDDAGNIFVRRGGNTGPDLRTNMSYELGYGHIYKRNDDGTYSDLTGDETSSHVDLNGLGLEKDAVQWVSQGDIFDGRVDYYAMSGNIAEGTAYLYVSSHRSKKAVRAKLTYSNGAITADIDNATIITLKNQETGEDFDYGDENFVFPVNCSGRTDYIYNLRSRGYFDILPGTSSTEQKSIYETQSRVNQAGGCTIEFNDELFLITPQCVYSQNSGNFIVAIGTKESTESSAASADLSNPIPVAQWTQKEITDGSYSNANGVWLCAVPGLIAGEVDLAASEADKADCVYIYEYVPGVRFAKYRLIPDNYFPSTPVDIEIEAVHGKTEYGDEDLIRYDGTAKFEPVEEAEDDNTNYVIASYTYTFSDAAGADVWTYTIVPGEDGSYTYTYTRVTTNENGEVVTETGSGEGTLVTETDSEGNTSSYFVLQHEDLKRDVNYQSTVTVNYVNKNDENDTHSSETTIDEDNKNYTPEAPVVEDVTVYEGKEGSSVEGAYRIEVNFAEPEEEPEEPVSYYVVYVTKPVVDDDGNQVYDENGNPETVTEEVKGFVLMVNGDPDDNDGDYYDYIPGTYDFEANEGKWDDDESKTNSTIVFFYDKSDTTDGTSTDPTTWTYTIEAVYGATNENVKAEASDEGPANKESLPTSVEDLANGAQQISVYPVPAHTTITVTAPEAVNSLKVLSISGAVVMSTNGNGDTKMTLDISSLSSGHYLLEINNSSIVRIIKD